MTIVLGLLGGLALFLYGMQMMSGGLEAAAGSKMKKILEKLTSNRFLGVAIGAGITALVQSSSATTVMLVGLVNSGVMTLLQAIWIIMGANIGTTTTGLLISLDVGEYAPIVAFIGVAIIMFIKRAKVQHYGQIVAGLGILFIGMEMMSAAMMPLRESQVFIDLMVQFQNPIIGILVGAVFTALIQSSAASIGILQGLAASGLIGLSGAVYVLFGQNIGTCITALLASFGANRSAKRTTIVHFLFNVIGTTIFTLLCVLTPFTSFIEGLFPNNPSLQIANMHIIFNIATTLILLPFGKYLAKLATKILPEREDEGDGMRLMYIKPLVSGSDYQVGAALITTTGVRKELSRMAEMARENLGHSFDAILEGAEKYAQSLTETEEYIDFLNKEIARYISKATSFDHNESDSKLLNAMFKTSGDLERIGDHALNIFEYTAILEDKGIGFSDLAKGEIEEMKRQCNEAMLLLGDLSDMSYEGLSAVADAEQKIDDATKAFRANQMERMRSGACSGEACVIYSELLTDFERIGDHILNIAQSLARA